MSIGGWRKKLRLEIQHRQEMKAQIEALSAVVEHVNWKILKVLQKHNKNEIVLAGLKTQIIRPQDVQLKEKAILRWYKKHQIVPPVKRVFDSEQFEKDITEGVVPAKLLEKYSVVTDKDPYVRISKAKE